MTSTARLPGAHARTGVVSYHSKQRIAACPASAGGAAAAAEAAGAAVAAAAAAAAEPRGRRWWRCRVWHRHPRRWRPRGSTRCVRAVAPHVHVRRLAALLHERDGRAGASPGACAFCRLPAVQVGGKRHVHQNCKKCMHACMHACKHEPACARAGSGEGAADCRLGRVALRGAADDQNDLPPPQGAATA
eukprot:242021-Chlamydomonas_euryale.AAC.4